MGVTRHTTWRLSKGGIAVARVAFRIARVSAWGRGVFRNGK